MPVSEVDAARRPASAAGSRISVVPDRSSSVAPARAAMAWAWPSVVPGATVTSTRSSAVVPGAASGAATCGRLPAVARATVGSAVVGSAPAGTAARVAPPRRTSATADATRVRESLGMGEGLRSGSASSERAEKCTDGHTRFGARRLPNPDEIRDRARGNRRRRGGRCECIPRTPTIRPVRGPNEEAMSQTVAFRPTRHARPRRRHRHRARRRRSSAPRSVSSPSPANGSSPRVGASLRSRTPWRTGRSSHAPPPSRHASRTDVATRRVRARRGARPAGDRPRCVRHRSARVHAPDARSREPGTSRQDCSGTSSKADAGIGAYTVGASQQSGEQLDVEGPPGPERTRGGGDQRVAPTEHLRAALRVVDP